MNTYRKEVAMKKHLLAATASAQIALGSGISTIMVCAISAYFLAFITLCFKKI
jgi:hypothetical protein